MTPLVLASSCNQGLSLQPYPQVLYTVHDSLQIGYCVFNSLLYNVFFLSLSVSTAAHFAHYDSFLPSFETLQFCSQDRIFLPFHAEGGKMFWDSGEDNWG